jgi:hypothetical protein
LVHRLKARSEAFEPSSSSIALPSLALNADAYADAPADARRAGRGRLAVASEHAAGTRAEVLCTLVE